MTRDSAPLSDLTVLDFSRYLPAQLCTWMLADFGARVIRIENPRELRKLDAAFNTGSLPAAERAQRKAAESLSRNKRSVIVDLGHEQSAEVIHALAAQAGAVVEDYRPGVLERLGFGYEALRTRNPRLNYCSVTYGGQHGPCRDKPGHDQLALAVSGILSRVGEDASRPAFPNVPIADIVTGLSAAIGILTAHHATARSGVGQLVDISMLDATTPFIAWFLSRYPGEADVPARGAHRVDFGVFRTRDGHHVCTTNVEPAYWRRFCEVLGREDFIPLQHDQGQWDSMRATLADIIATRTLSDWMERFRQHEIQAAPVRSFHEALDDPHFRARGMAFDVACQGGAVLQVGNPVTLSRTPAEVTRLGEVAGTSTRDVLEEYGFSAGKIDSFLANGAVALPAAAA